MYLYKSSKRRTGQVDCRSRLRLPFTVWRSQKIRCLACPVTIVWEVPLIHVSIWTQNGAVRVMWDHSEQPSRGAHSSNKIYALPIPEQSCCLRNITNLWPKNLSISIQKISIVANEFYHIWRSSEAHKSDFRDSTTQPSDRNMYFIRKHSIIFHGRKYTTTIQYKEDFTAAINPQLYNSRQLFLRFSNLKDQIAQAHQTYSRRTRA